MTICPICVVQLKLLPDSIIGELLECQDCGTELFITGVDPITVEIAPPVDEDWGQ